jgi:hypothetical protein
MEPVKCNLQVHTPRGLVTVTGWDSWESYSVNLDVTITTVVDNWTFKHKETWHSVPMYVIQYLGLSVTPTYRTEIGE